MFELGIRDSLNCEYRKIKFVYLSYISLKSFVFAWVLSSYYFLEKGLSISDISILLIFTALLNIVFELPTGVLADIFNKRKLLVIAPMIVSLKFIFFFLAGDSIFLYLVGIVFWVLGRCIISGTLEANLYESLDYIGKKHKYYKISMYGYVFNCILAAASVLAGGFIADYFGSDFVMLVSAIPFVAAGFCAFFFVDLDVNKHDDIIDIEKVKNKKLLFVSHLRNIILVLKTTPVFKYLIIFCSLLTALYGILDDFNTIIYSSFGYSYKQFGFFETISMFSSVFFGFVMYKLRVFNMNIIVCFIGIICFASILFIKNGALSVLVFITAIALMETLTIRVNSTLQDLILKESRATLLSFNVFVSNIFVSINVLFVGYILGGYAINFVFVYVLFLSCLLMILAYVCNRKKL